MPKMPPDPAAATHPGPAPAQPWYKEAIIYEVPVRAFADSNADGIGDLPGLLSRLDYLADLGVTALWLLPFYPSPGRDAGYDIADYTDIDPVYGTLDDFKRLLDEAGRRGLRVITELVLNHTSSAHRWFQRARRAPSGSPQRDFYVWSDSPERYADARIIFKDFESSNWSWDPVAKAYYWHRFYAHQPDLNFDNPAVQEALLGVVDFWFGMGVAGMRLDAVPYLFEREGTSCENLPETHQFLKRLRAHVDTHFQDRMLLAEANQWPIDAAEYFGAGDECHMNFHFPLMPRLFMAVQLEDRFPVIDILRQTPVIPDNCQWATFLRNHDELTLEMVTDEDRDYMYRAYAEDPTARLNLGIRRRLAPLLRSRRKIELVNGLLFSLPGTPVLYYGDEIGMGDNIYLGDRDGVRTPMQWSADRNAGFSQAPTQRLYLPVIADREYHYEACNVEVQQQNPSSLLWWMKRLISFRKENRVLGGGTIEFLHPANPKILAFVRQLGEARVLVVANLSRYVQHCELALGAHEGLVPIEMFGRVRFPTIGKGPFFVTLAPHGFYWFSLEHPDQPAAAEYVPPTLTAPSWRELLELPGLARALGEHVVRRRWFRAKDRSRKRTVIQDLIPGEGEEAERSALVVVGIPLEDGDTLSYVVAPTFISADAAVAHESRGQAIIARAQVAGVAGLVIDGLATGTAARPLLDAIVRPRRIAGRWGTIEPRADAALVGIVGGETPTPRVLEVEQTNSVFPVESKLLLKVFRQLESGDNPELELGEFFARVGGGGLVPRLVGSLRYRPAGAKATAALMSVHEFVRNEGNCWDQMVSSLHRMFERVLTAPELVTPAFPAAPLLQRVGQEPPPEVRQALGPDLEQARTLGRRTAALHQLLASDHEDPAFAPEPLLAMHQESLYQAAHTLLVRTFQALRGQLGSLEAEPRALAQELVEQEAALDTRLRRIRRGKLDVDRIRCHGDLHLGQVLRSDAGYVFIDFEGEPARRLHERRYKRAAFRDATGMLRSFSYAAETALRTGPQRSQDVTALAPWARSWAEWVQAAYLAAYLEVLEGTRLVPRSPADRERLLDFFTLEKCIYEVHYELGNRPAWLAIPLRGLRELLASAEALKP